MGITGPHFSEAELACHHGINGCTQALVDAAEALRAVIGKPMRVHDAFRCPQCNALLKNAATHSQHMLGSAIDFDVEGMSGAELEAAARQVTTIHGIGRSDHSNYLHIDVRPALVLVAWCYDAGGKEIAYYAPQQTTERPA
jgi:uncharacterized protein YcbK (DUF882 family)